MPNVVDIDVMPVKRRVHADGLAERAALPPPWRCTRKAEPSWCQIGISRGELGLLTRLD
jgi:hypothetical protein